MKVIKSTVNWVHTAPNPDLNEARNAPRLSEVQLAASEFCCGCGADGLRRRASRLGFKGFKVPLTGSLKESIKVTIRV